MRLLMVLVLALGLGACDKEKSQPPQADANATIGKVDISHVGKEAPAIPFEGPNGGPATLAAFRGKPLIVNLWATWCAPCVHEMPTLDALAEREKDRLQLIVVSMDMGGRRDVDPFFAKAKFKALQPYVDKQNVLLEALRTETLPTTIFYDAKGREQWRVTGAMDWTSERARTLIDGAINPPVKG